MVKQEWAPWEGVFTGRYIDTLASTQCEVCEAGECVNAMGAMACLAFAINATSTPTDEQGMRVPSGLTGGGRQRKKGMRAEGGV